MKRSTRFGFAAILVWLGGMAVILIVEQVTHMASPHLSGAQLAVFALILALNWSLGYLSGHANEAEHNERAGADHD